MEASIFKDFISTAIKGVFSGITAKLNGKPEELKYEHSKYLKKQFSPDMKFSSLSTNTSVVAADVVSLDSPLSLKKRGSYRSAEGEIPKLGMKKALTETALQALENLKARGGRELQIIEKLFQDAADGVKGINERLDIMFLQALSTGVTLIDDSNNTGTGVRIDFGVPAANQYGVSVNWAESTSTPINDIDRILNAARDKGYTMRYMWIDRVTFNIFKNHAQLKKAFAGSAKVDSDFIFRLKNEEVLSYILEEYNLNVIVIDKVSQIEKNGVKTSIEPWERGNITFTTTMDVGSVTYGELAEVNHPVKDVEYSIVDQYILVSMFRTNDPLKENTSVQALALPVLDNTDAIFILDTQEAEVVDAGETEGDADITIWGEELTKADVITNFKLVSTKPVESGITDAKLIALINTLSDKQERELKDLLSVS